ncbi:MAG TPA: site-specific integrase [Pirellulales bacterium]|nr:site-specific integrase [Pirellulales bacterium]
MPVEKRRARRGRGEGSIFQRADGRWAASITIGIDANCKRVRKTVYGGTKGEVAAKLTKLAGQKLDGTLASTEKLTIAAFLDRWLEDAARPSVRSATYACYKGIIDNHVSPKIGGLRLDRLTPVHVQSFYAALEREGVGYDVRRLCHAVLRRALKQAVKLGMVARNACDAAEPPRRTAKREIQPLDGEQVAKLFRAAEGERLEALYVVAVSTGMRLGELFGLQWGDIDLDNGVITVVRKLSEVNGKLRLEEPKTAKGRRRIDLPAIAVDALLDHRKAMLAEGNLAAGYVFCNSQGGPLRRSHFHAQRYKPLLSKAGLPDIRFHDLRHSHATLLLLGGAHPKIVQERLGHSQISVTMDIYSHVLPGMQRQAADNLNAMFAADAKALKAAERAEKRAAKRGAAAG